MRHSLSWTKFLARMIAVCVCCVPYTSALCGGRSLRIVASIQPMGYLCERLMEETAQISVVLPPGADPHTFDLSSAALRRIEEADAFVMVGSGVDFERAWLSKIVKNRPSMAVVYAAKGIALSAEDPHVWVSFENSRQIVKTLAQFLARIDPTRAARIEARATQLDTELTASAARLRVLIEGSAQRSFVVMHSAWGYTAREFGLTELAIEHEGKDPSPRHMASVISAGRAAGVKTVFVSSYRNQALARSVARALDARIVSVDPVGRTYLAEIEKLITEIVRQ